MLAKGLHATSIAPGRFDKVRGGMGESVVGEVALLLVVHHVESESLVFLVFILFVGKGSGSVGVVVGGLLAGDEEEESVNGDFILFAKFK